MPKTKKKQERSRLSPGIYFDPSSKTYQIDTYIQVKGVRIHLYRFGLASLEEAKKELSSIKKENKANKPIGKALTLDSFFEEFLNYRSLRVRESSLLSAKSAYHGFLREKGEKPIDEVFSYPSLTRIYQSIVKKEEISASWKNRIIGILRCMLGYASKRHYVSPNVYANSLPLLENLAEDRQQKKQKTVYSEKQLERFLSVIEKKEDKLLFTLFFSLGARISEFLGLTFDCIDFQNSSIIIRQQLVGNSQKTFLLSPLLKTRVSYRRCRIASSLKKALFEHKETHKDQIFLFSSPINASLPLSKANLRYLLRKYAKLASLPTLTPHAARHMMATRLVKASKNMLEIEASAKFMGHSPSMMMDVYSHSEEKTIDAVLRRLEKDYGKNKNKEEVDPQKE